MSFSLVYMYYRTFQQLVNSISGESGNYLENIQNSFPGRIGGRHPPFAPM